MFYMFIDSLSFVCLVFLNLDALMTDFCDTISVFANSIEIVEYLPCLCLYHYVVY